MSLNQSPTFTTQFPVGTLLNRTVIGPCGFGAEVVADADGKYVTIEHYNGDRESIWRKRILRVLPS